MAFDEDVDYGTHTADVTALKEPDAKLDEKLLYLIGRVAVIRQLLEEEAPMSPTTVKRLKRLQKLVTELPVPEVEKPRKVGFGT